MKNLTFTVLLSLLLSSGLMASNGPKAQIPTKTSSGSVSLVQPNYDDENLGKAYDYTLTSAQLIPGHSGILSFNLAYASQELRYDSMAIQVSPDGGVNWQTIFYSGGNALSTTSSTSEYFIPMDRDWKSYQFDLGPFSGDVRIRFHFINGHGNNLYIDELGIQDAQVDSGYVKNEKQ